MDTNASCHQCYLSESITVTPTISLRHKWTIVNFSDLRSQYTDSAFFSPPFSRDKWFLRLKQNNWSDSSGYFTVTLFLHSCENSDKVIAKYSLSLVDIHGIHRFTKNSLGAVTFIPQNHVDSVVGVVEEGNEYQIIVPRNAFIAYGNAILGKDDTVQVSCRITLFGSTRSILKRHAETKLYMDHELNEGSFMQDIISFINQTPPEVTIETSDGKLKAHKPLLQSRSSVFREMLSAENQGGENRISTLEFNSQVMKSLLQFIYTDSVTNVESFADKLLTAAKKFNLPKLKKICEDILVTTLTTKNAGHLLSLSDCCGAPKLKEKILEFIASNASRVCVSHDFEEKVANPYLYKETLNAIFKKPRLEIL